MNKIIKKQKIIIDETKVWSIMNLIGCSRATVYNALAFRSNSPMAGDIRKLAVSRYGGEICKVPMIRK